MIPLIVERFSSEWFICIRETRQDQVIEWKYSEFLSGSFNSHTHTHLFCLPGGFSHSKYGLVANSEGLF